MSDYDRNLSDQELAKMWLGYGFDHEPIGAEMERRWPRLAGWKAAADHLARLHGQKWADEQMAAGTYSLNVLGPDDQDPGAVTLLQEYRESVECLAAGN